ncbi:MAG: 1-acyl-sn-glycerol-3-phosphate acyltransferase [Treponema sp.]|nr:1-acyl-sn-glycerol-3-phosphate acyltransferase [Treponema sp.]
MDISHSNASRCTKNPIVFFLRTIAKLSCYFVFGLATIAFSITLLPLLLIFVHPYGRFQRVCRRILHICLICYRWYLRIVGVAKVKVSDKAALKNAKSVIIAANHPSLLDSVILVSFLPCTDFIVKMSLSKRNVLSFIVNLLLTPNSIDYKEIIERTKKNFAAGGTIAVFPEGTRSLPTGQNRFKKGAARLSLATGCPILPVYIGGNDKFGLRKGEKIWQINPNGAYEYVFTVKDLLYPDEFAGLPEPIAAKRYTAKLRAILADENNVPGQPPAQNQV